MTEPVNPDAFALTQHAIDRYVERRAPAWLERSRALRDHLGRDGVRAAIRRSVDVPIRIGAQRWANKVSEARVRDWRRKKVRYHAAWPSVLIAVDRTVVTVIRADDDDLATLLVHALIGVWL